MTQHIGFIGGGNMARSLIGGMMANGFPPQHVHVCDTNADALAGLEKEFNVRTTDNAHAIINDCDAVMLAVKPQVMEKVVSSVCDAITQHTPLLISIAAGITTHALNDWGTGGDDSIQLPIVRCMPNTPSLLQCGATAMFATPAVSAEQKNLTDTLLNAVGISAWVDNEPALDAITALSGSGPAYFFAFMEAMQTAAIEQGLPKEIAATFTLQTALGAARMAVESGEDISVLRERVTSKGGTTAAALASFAQSDLNNAVRTAMQAAHDRSQSLAQELTQSS